MLKELLLRLTNANSRSMKLLAKLLFLSCFLSVSSRITLAEPVFIKPLDSYVKRTAQRIQQNTKLGLQVMSAESGATLYSYSGAQLLIPASVLKVIPTAAALQLLGSNYRFPTEIFADRMPNGGGGNVGNLYVRGYGDPTVVNENLWQWAQALHQQGVRAVGDIVIDDTLFLDPPQATGSNPYQAGLSAVSLNHNSYAVEVYPGVENGAALVHLTPGAPYRVVNKLRTARSSARKVNISESAPRADAERGINVRDVIVSGEFGFRATPETFYQTVSEPSIYFGAVLRHFLEREGVSVRGVVRRRAVPEGVQKLRVFHSKELSLIVRDLNYYSNNFIAGQILYALGQDSLGYFRKDLGLERLGEFLARAGVPQGSYRIVEASGLDRQNHLSAQQLARVLVHAYRDFSIAPDFVASLSRFGHTGTLKGRRLSPQRRASALDGESSGRGEVFARENGVWGKTGTLRDVSTLIGFAVTAEGQRVAFAILLNGVTPSVSFKEIEDEIVRIIIQ